MLENLYTTKMSGDAKTLQKRFSKIRSKQSRKSKITAAVMAAVLAMTALFATVAMAAIEGISDNEIKYEVYNGDKKISLNSQPFIYDGEYYLPLRDVLNGFGIMDIKYDNGVVDIAFPDHQTDDYASKCRFIIGKNLVYLDSVSSDMKSGVVILGIPILHNDLTYVPLTAIEEIMREGQMTDFLINIIRPTEPEHYYTKDEKVFIGTAQEQDNYDGELVKRIIVDENGETIAVIPIENQMSENISARYERAETAGAYLSYYDTFYNGVIGGFYDVNDNSVYQTVLNLIEQELPMITENSSAYIAPADIIKIPENEFNKGLKRIIENTYKNE